MRAKTLCHVALLPLFAGVVAASHAQTAPPIKPGLWQVTPQRSVNGAPPVDMGDRMKSMSPEVRKKVEESMKARGMAPAGPGGQLRVCFTKEFLDRGHWQAQTTNCKTESRVRTGSHWAWHTSCTAPASETDGEAHFGDAENYVVKTATKMTLNGKPHASQTTVTAKWLGSDCGDVKPFAPPTAPSAPGKK
jgi:hypothetical protein